MIPLQCIIALLGVSICAIGVIVGRKFTVLRVWMGVSSVVGIASFLLWNNSIPNIFVSNLWILLNVVVLLPFLSLFSLNSCKPGIYALIAICSWMWFVHVLNHGIHEFAPMLRVVTSLAIVMACGLSALAGKHRVLLITLALAAMCDAVLYSFSLEWFKSNPPHGAWAIRNLVWCGVYISMAYTVRRR